MDKINEQNLFECKLPTYEEFNENKEGIKDLIVKRWSDIGFTNGTEGKIKDDLSFVFEDAARKFISNDEKTMKAEKDITKLWCSMSYEMDSFAILRRVNVNPEYKIEKPYKLDDLSDYIINNAKSIKDYVINKLIEKGYKDADKFAELDMEAVFCANIEKLIILDLNKEK